MKHIEKKRKLIILIGLYVLASLALRIYYLYEFSFSPLFETPRGPDVEEYCIWAKEIVAGRILWPYVKIHAPLYPFFLALLYSFFANAQHCFYYIRLTQIMLGFAAFIPLCGTILLINKKQNNETNSNSRNMLITFLILWGWYPPLIYYLGELTSEILLIPLLSTAVFMLYKGEAASQLAGKKNPSEKRDMENMEEKDETIAKQAQLQTGNAFMVAAGICSGLAIIAHPLALFFLFSEVIYLFLQKNIKGLAAYGLCACLMVLPITFYNIVILKEAIPIQANGGFNLYLGNNEDADGTCRLRPGPEWDAFHLGADYKSREIGISKDSLLIQKTVKFIFNNPLHWLKLLGQKALFVWNQREITAGADLYPLRYYTSFQHVFSWSFGICATLALMALFLNWTNWSFYIRYRHVLILIGAFWIAQTLLVTSGRYRVAMVPCILILTAWTLTHALSFLKQRKGNYIRLALALLAAVAIVYIPQAPYNAKREEGETNTLLGEAYLLEREYEKAEYHLLSAIKNLPPWSRNYNLLGLVKEKQHKDREARDYYLKAKKTDSSDPDAFMNLALLFSRKKEPKKAVDFFKKAFTLKKPSAELFYNYGLFCFNNGEKKEAGKNYLTCLKINPAHEMALNNLGIIAFMQGKYIDATAYFEKALLLDPRNTRRMVNLAAAKFATNKNIQAENILDKALKINPNLSTAKELKNRIHRERTRLK
jgi:Tfp pilus assembly protein PilF